MATAITDNLLVFRDQCARFARQYIASRHDLTTTSKFPWDIWRQLGRENLMGLGIPEEFGGMGADALAIVVAGEALVHNGGNLGMVLSWMIHQILSRFFIMQYGNSIQRQTYLPDLSRGTKTLSMAISEPKTGAHPKYLQTSARLIDGEFHLTGEKTYVTNAPIADLFIVFAITACEAHRKRFSAFLLPRDTPGLFVSDPIELPFLRPSPHGGIVLKDCRLGTEAIIGQTGSAYEEIALPFRQLEDTFMLGPFAGAMQRQIDLLVQCCNTQGVTTTEKIEFQLGDLQAMVHSLRIMAYEAAMMIDRGGNHPESPSIVLYARNMAVDFQSKIKDFLSFTGLKREALFDQITNDLAQAVMIARNVADIKQKKLGKFLLDFTQ